MTSEHFQKLSREHILFLFQILGSNHYLIRLIKYNNYFWLPQTPKCLNTVLFTHYRSFGYTKRRMFHSETENFSSLMYRYIYYITIKTLYYSVIGYAFVVLFGSYRASLFVGILPCAWWRVHCDGEEIKTKSLRGLGLYGPVESTHEQSSSSWSS